MSAPSRCASTSSISTCPPFADMTNVRCGLSLAPIGSGTLSTTTSSLYLFHSVVGLTVCLWPHSSREGMTSRVGSPPAAFAQKV